MQSQNAFNKFSNYKKRLLFHSDNLYSNYLNFFREDLNFCCFWFYMHIPMLCNKTWWILWHSHITTSKVIITRSPRLRRQVLVTHSFIHTTGWLTLEFWESASSANVLGGPSWRPSAGKGDQNFCWRKTLPEKMYCAGDRQGGQKKAVVYSVRWVIASRPIGNTLHTGRAKNAKRGAVQVGIYTPATAPTVNGRFRFKLFRLRWNDVNYLCWCESPPGLAHTGQHVQTESRR